MTQPDNGPVQAPPMTELELLREELHLFKTAGIIEIAVRNPNVSSWLIEWENRAIKAEEAARSAYAEGEKAGMERAERKSDAMQQLAYANGLKAGWNMAEAGESIAHPERVAALVQEAMTELSAIRAAKETKNPPSPS